METNFLIKYMNDRVMHFTKKMIDPGPVITISRECGCAGGAFAEKLTESINKKINDPAKNWKWVSKEILNLASKELKINPDQIKSLLNLEEKTLLDKMVFSFADKYYVNDAKIRIVIQEVIRNIAIRGNAVIVGRGSEALTLDIPRSLHVRLYAPLSWKTAVISERGNISHEEAKKIVIQVDKQRAKFRDAYLHKNKDIIANDIEFNCAKFSQEEMVSVILNIAELKSLI